MCLCRGGEGEGWKGSMGCSGKGTPLLPEGRGRMSGDIQADFDSVEGLWREGGSVVCACFLFCCGRRGARWCCWMIEGVGMDDSNDHQR